MIQHQVNATLYHDMNAHIKLNMDIIFGSVLMFFIETERNSSPLLKDTNRQSLSFYEPQCIVGRDVQYPSFRKRGKFDGQKKFVPRKKGSYCIAKHITIP